MILLDAYAVIAYLQADPHAGAEVRRLIAVEDSPAAALGVVNAAEVLDHLIRIRGVDPDAAVLDVAQLGLDVRPVDDRIGVLAGLLRARHYHPRQRQVSLADCFAAATLLVSDDIEGLATSDPHLLDLVHAEGGHTVPLPDSDGTTWKPAGAP